MLAVRKASRTRQPPDNLSHFELHLKQDAPVLRPALEGNRLGKNTPKCRCITFLRGKLGHPSRYGTSRFSASASCPLMPIPVEYLSVAGAQLYAKPAPAWSWP